MTGNLFENNTFKDCATPITCGYDQGKNIVRDSSESNGATVSVGAGCNGPVKATY